MKARASIAACDGRLDLRSEAPLVLRRTPDGVYLVSGAAGPIGGDELALDVHVGPGASLRVRSATAQIALPGDGPSRFVVRANVSSGGSLSWLPEPTIAVKGCRHEIDVHLTCAQDAVVVWREEVVLGREREPSGVITTHMRVDVGGRPVLRQTLKLGERSVVVGDARAVGAMFLLGSDFEERADAGVASMKLAAAGALVSAVAPDAITLRTQLEIDEPTRERVVAALRVLPGEPPPGVPAT